MGYTHLQSQQSQHLKYHWLQNFCNWRFCNCVNRHAMNKSYCDEVSENLTVFVTECIFVDYAIRERRGKQK